MPRIKLPEFLSVSDAIETHADPIPSQIVLPVEFPCMFEALEFRVWSSLTLLVNSSVTAGPVSMPEFSIARVFISI
jgi:hypothetical protein